MLELGVRHLPVVRSGRLVGVLSIRDLLLGADGGRW
jgi:CBS domain-containing protein